MNIIKINGLEASDLPVRHRGTAYGDGLFETMRAHQGHIVALEEHLARLALGVGVLQLSMPLEQWQSLRLQLQELALQVHDEHVFKVMVLRNAVGRGYDYDPNLQTTDIVIQCAPYHLIDYSRGYRIAVADSPISENTTLAGLKHLNRLDSVLAKQSARKQQVEDVLLCTHDNLVIEATSSNVFFKIRGSWLTPKIDRAGVKGVARQRLLSQFPHTIAESELSLSDISAATAMFISNSLTGCIAVTDLLGQSLRQDNDIKQFHQYLRG